MHDFESNAFDFLGSFLSKNFKFQFIEQFVLLARERLGFPRGEAVKNL